MRRVTRRAAIFLGFAVGGGVAGASCSLTTDLSGLTGGASGGTPDGGNDGSVAPDASDGGVLRDSTAPVDAPADVRADATVDAQAFCAAHPGHALCDDFDEPGFRDAWNGGTTNTGGSTLFQDPDAYTSAPYSLAFAMPSAEAGIGAQLATKFSELPSEIDVSFDLWIVEAGNSGAALVEVQLPSGQGFVVLVKGTTPVSLDAEEYQRNPEGGTEYSGFPGLVFTLQRGQWYSVSLALALANPDGGLLSLSVGAAGPLSGTPGFAPVLSGASIRLLAGVADYAALPLGAWTVRLDNVVVDLK